MESEKFIPMEDLPVNERAILTLLDMLDEVHKRMKVAKGNELHTLSLSATSLVSAISALQ